MNPYQKINNIAGWIIFAIAAFVYTSTIEPTGSFWDCGEFIATANKLQVGHPPGAPLFLMLSRIMILFAGDDVKSKAVMVNIMSALMSAFTILFLFWTITALAKKIFMKAREAVTTDQIISVIGCGAVGALAYTFSDSFWFSAVEGEVYASSAFFTAIVFWSIFKWEGVADERHGVRWIVLIAYLMGLSIGVHLLNLLCIPALAFVYYFRKHKPTTMGIIKTSVVSVLLLGFIQFGVIGGFVNIGSKFELLFVNGMGMPFWSGFLFYCLIVSGLIVYGLFYTRKNNKPLLNTVILSFTFILIGYSSYAQIVIRANADPPMDENNPENPFSLLSYLNRDQYGDFPILYGQYYNARVVDQKEGAMSYAQLNGKYVETGRKIIPVYDPKACTLLPRMWSSQENHIQAYKEWSGVKGDAIPTFAQNISFLWKYQLGHMYWRYFMWNFVGRQNDKQGHGGILNGNWISGFPGIDAIRLGPQDKLPKSMTSNKGMNKFYFLPLILGLAGMVYHFKKNKLYAWVVLLLFFFTGVAIIMYLNGPPFQPRERDYAYAGSFYAFAMWIGLGTGMLIDFLKKKMNPAVGASLATVICMGVPVLMAKDGWNDHDRSHRYTPRDFAFDYLNSCAPNAILFTNGDNDTFPLWYAQEVEGIRTDVRVVNLSLLNTDWYIEQMKRKAYDSDPVPFTWKYSQYIQGTRDYVPFYDRGLQVSTELKDVVDFMGSDSPDAKARTQGGNEINYFPTKKFKITIDKNAVLKSGTVPASKADQIVPVMEWEIDKNYLMKADMMILNLLAYNNWKRPVYFAVTVGNDSYLNMEDYFQLEGLAYRIVPVKAPRTPDGQIGSVNTGDMYNNMVNKFVWGNMNDSRVYLDQNNLNMTMNFRNNFARLAENLMNEGKKDSAVKALDHCMEVMPDHTVPYNIMMLRIADLYYRAGSPETPLDSAALANTMGDPEQKGKWKQEQTDKANAIVKRLADIYEDDLNYYLSLKGTEYVKGVDREMNQGMAVMQELKRMAASASQKPVADDLEKRFKALEPRFYGK